MGDFVKYFFAHLLQDLFVGIIKKKRDQPMQNQGQQIGIAPVGSTPQLPPTEPGIDWLDDGQSSGGTLPGGGSPSDIEFLE